MAATDSLEIRLLDRTIDRLKQLSWESVPGDPLWPIATVNIVPRKIRITARSDDEIQNLTRPCITVSPLGFSAPAFRGENQADDVSYSFAIQIIGRDEYDPIRGMRTLSKWREQIRESLRLHNFYDIVNVGESIYHINVDSADAIDPRFWWRHAATATALQMTAICREDRNGA